MAKCFCGHEMTKAEWKHQWVCHRCGRTKPLYESITNADRIRSMTDEELAWFLCKVKADYQWVNQEFPREDEGGEWEEWLKSEVGCE